MKNKKKPSKNPNGSIHPTRIFRTPNELLTAWNEYKKDVEEQGKEWTKVQYVGRDGTRKVDEYKIPLTIEGFKRFCRNNYGEVGPYLHNQDGYYEEFITICNAIKEEVRENHIVGGMLGVYNPSITQRLHGLTEKTETKQEGDITISFKD